MKRHYILITLLVVVSIFSEQCIAQKSNNILINGKYENALLTDVIKDIQKNHSSIIFSFIADQLKDYKVSAQLKDEPLSIAIAVLLEGTPLKFYIIDPANVVIFRDNNNVVTHTKRFAFRGKIVSNVNEILPMVEVHVPGLNKTTYTNNEGYFELLNMPKGKHLIKFKKDQYYKFNEFFFIGKDEMVSIQLTKESRYALNESSADIISTTDVALLDKEIVLTKQTGTLKEILHEIGEKGQFTFSYNMSEIPLTNTVDLPNTNNTVKYFLDELFKNTNIEYIDWGTKIILKRRQPGSKKVTIHGTVKEKTSGESLPGVNVLIQGTTIGTTTNAYGYYSLTVPTWDYRLIFSYIGYKTKRQEVMLENDIRVDVALEEELSQLKEVVVNAETAQQHIEKTNIGTTTLKVETIKSMPALLGEVDIVKSLLMLPGVSTVGEGAPGFNVRGGSIDQNLILLDEAQIYNSSHLLGLFSVFNPDAVKDVVLYKGGIPAFYGGRISSVMDVTQKEGSNVKLKGSGGLGLVFSRLAIEAPIIKNKASFIVAARRSYVDLFFKNKYLQRKFDLPSGNEGYFMDINTKLNYQVDERNRIYLSGYFGNDNYKIGGDSHFAWGNITGTLRWNNLISDKLFSNHVLIFSNYLYNQGVPEGYIAYDGKIEIKNYQAKSDFTYYHNEKHKIDFGINTIVYELHPGNARPLNDSSIFVGANLPHQFAVEPALYVSDEFKVNEKITIQTGLRYSMYANAGPGVYYHYERGRPRNSETFTDTVKLKRGELSNFYSGFEPRIAATYVINLNSSLKLGYNRMRQYIHLVSNTTSATPLDVYKLSNNNIEPQIGDQITLGYFRNLRGSTLETSAEIYYKGIRNLLEYRNGADLVINERIDEEIFQGIGRAYGIELMVNKKVGRLTGWTAYTFSRTERKVENDRPREQVNNGEWYPANYDQPHRINIVAMYQLSKRLSVAADFIYNTGRPATYPDGQFVYLGKVFPSYSTRNQERIPDYHRLDFSITLEGRGNKLWKGSWTLSVYNLYSRDNAYSIYFREKAGSKDLETVKLSIIGSAVPSLAYNFTF